MPASVRAARLSPLHHKLAERCAEWKDYCGWLVAERIGDPETEARAARSGVGLLDCSERPKFELKGTNVGDLLENVLGGKPPEVGRVATGDSACFIRLSSQHAWYVLDRADSAVPKWVHGRAPAGVCGHVTDRSDGYGSVLLHGPRASAVLSKLTALDLRDKSFPDLSAAASPMASIRTILIRRDRAPLPAYEVFFSREYGEYFWDVLMQAGEEFQMMPMGRAAARLLRLE